jgi:hypothetical protein
LQAPGDITGAGSVPDGEVNSSDLLLVLTPWGEPGGAADLAPESCGDGTVDIDDYLVVNNNWGECVGEGFGGGGDDPVEILLAILDEHPGLSGPIEQIIEFLGEKRRPSTVRRRRRIIFRYPSATRTIQNQAEIVGKRRRIRTGASQGCVARPTRRAVPFAAWFCYSKGSFRLPRKGRERPGPAPKEPGIP